MEKKKQVIKAKDLPEHGFDYSQKEIRQMCHMKGSPFFQYCEGGIWYVDLDDLRAWNRRLAGYKEVTYFEKYA